MAKQVGFYNQTHKHGEPLENLIAKLKAKRAGGEPDRSGATRDHALDPTQAGWNRQNAPVGEMPPWVARQIAQQGGLPAVPPGIPPGVNPTKPTAVQGSDSLTGLQPAQGAYPIRRPANMPPPGPPRLRQKPRRLPSWMQG